MFNSQIYKDMEELGRLMDDLKTKNDWRIAFRRTRMKELLASTFTLTNSMKDLSIAVGQSSEQLIAARKAFSHFDLQPFEFVHYDECTPVDWERYEKALGIEIREMHWHDYIASFLFDASRSRGLAWLAWPASWLMQAGDRIHGMEAVALFPADDNQISTGYVDADSSEPCPPEESII